MIYNTLKIAVRRALRHNGLAHINIIGLSAAMEGSLFKVARTPVMRE